MVDTIKEAILLWIGTNYGYEEMEYPCYNIEEMAKAVAEALEEE